MTERQKAVEKMIEKVMKKKDLRQQQAIEYILEIGTGKILSLERYRKTLPEGKKTKGIFARGPRKKLAPKTKKLTAYVTPAAAAAAEPKPKPKPLRKVTPSKPRKKFVQKALPFEAAAE